MKCTTISNFFIKPLKKLFMEKEYEYGVCDGGHARRHIRKGNVQHVAWEMGDDGNEFVVWVDLDPSYWDGFEIKTYRTE